MFSFFTKKETRIFGGSSRYSTTNFGGLRIEAEGDKLTLIHVASYQGQEFGRAELTVYDKNDLLALPAYTDAGQSTELKYLNTWHILDSKRAEKNIRLVYSDESDLGFVVEMDPGFEFKALDAFALSQHAFFRELSTFQKFEALGYPQDKLHALPMRDEQLEVLVANHAVINHLIHAGITVEQMAKMPVKRLELLLKNFNKLSDASHFLSLNQLSGLDHIPRAVPDKKDWPKPEGELLSHNAVVGNIKIWGSKNANGISYTKNGQEFKAEYKEKTVEGKEKAILDKTIQGHEISCQLLHDWYHIKNQDETTTLYYAPTISWLSSISQSAGFNLEEALGQDHSKNFLFNRERDFLSYIEARGIPGNRLLQTPGFTASKIQDLCFNLNAVKFLEERGMKFEDYASVDENRLAYVFECFERAKAALEFVDVFELFALRSTSPLLRAYQSRTGTTLAKERQEPDNSNNRFCLMM